MTFGARPLKRAIQTLIEDKMAEKMLEKTFSEGDSVVATGEDGKIVFTKKNGTEKSPEKESDSSDGDTRP